MSVRISDVKAKFYASDGGHGSNDRVQLEGLPSPTCWLRGVQFTLPTANAFISGGDRFDLVTSTAGEGDLPTQDQILISFPSPYYFGSQNFFFPEDSYFVITDSELYVTCSNDWQLNRYVITVYYT